MSETCPNCSAPKEPECSNDNHTQYACGTMSYHNEAFDGAAIEMACEYAASLRAERNHWRERADELEDELDKYVQRLIEVCKRLEAEREKVEELREASDE